MSKNASIDGFIPRRRVGNDAPFQGGLRPSMSNGLQPHTVVAKRREVATLAPHETVAKETTATGATGLSRQDIDQSLGTIDSTPRTEHKPRGKKRLQLGSKKRVIKWAALAIVLVLVGFGSYTGWKLLRASGNVFKGNILGLVQHQPLKEDGNGRSNIIVFGTSEDDAGHDGAYLTDSMMVVSIDQKNHNMYTFNVPRDLWVKYGRSCDAGNEGKINAVYVCYSNNAQDEDAGSAAVRDAVSKVTGLDIQYSVHVNYTVLKDAVDAVGGVDVDIEGDGPVPYGVKQGSILDRNFDWQCKYQCNYVKYAPGVHHLDGIHALYLARARGDVAPTYGLARANFDREVNQQKILKALQEKAVSTGTLTNYNAVNKLLDTVGTNLRTNFQTSEIRTLIDIAKDTKSSDIQSISLIDADPAVLSTSMIDGQSVVTPLGTYFDYSPISDYLKQRLSSDPVVREAAAIGVYNGGGPSGAAQDLATSLKNKGYNVVAVDNAGTDITSHYAIYDLSGGKKPKTLAKLESEYGVKVSTTQPPVTVTGEDIVIVIGPTPQPSQATK